MKNNTIIIFIIALLASIITTLAFNSEKMYAYGKIYVVLAVVTVMVTGLFVYLINLDRKITQLEKNIND